MIVLKILVAPFVVVLTVMAAVVSFLFCMASAVCVVACVVLTLLAVALVRRWAGSCSLSSRSLYLPMASLPSRSGWWISCTVSTMLCGASSQAE